jgi:glucokinase
MSNLHDHDATTLIAAVDLGGTNIRAALCDANGHILKRTRQLTRPAEGAEAVLNRIAESVHAVLPAGGAVRGVGVASPGPINPYSGVVLYAANLFWKDVPLRDSLGQRLRLPVRVGNDANLAALGEQRFGAGRGHANIVFVTLSTGVGCGVILNNQLVLGARGLATEAGHMTVNVDGPPIISGVPGAFEGYVAGPGIAKMAQARVRATTGSPTSAKLLGLAGGDITQISAKNVGEAAQQGDALALEIVREVARITGLGFVNLLHLFDPEIVVVGGSVTLMGDVLLDAIRENMRHYAMAPYKDVPLVLAALGDDCGLLGAAALFADVDQRLDEPKLL